MQKILNLYKYINLQHKIANRKHNLTFLLNKNYSCKYLTTSSENWWFEIANDQELNELYCELDNLIIGDTCG